ncbi:hypothetical protein M514_28058 [Trichuris suis]|uniref:RNA-directed DNA polymerase n=1 Tax=Trichuris suis TaxID=68888 RepID=A0A085MRB5_9BILA|nr:hypothetical protein M514_28058 [Trichuris suis]
MSQHVAFNLLSVELIDKLGLYDIPLNSAHSIANALCSKPPSKGNCYRKGTQVSCHLSARRLAVHPVLASAGLGVCLKAKASLRLKPEAKPVFRPKRPVPYAAVEEVEAELNRLESFGVISKVSHSNWAAPIVVVKKADGSFRVCTDFSTGLNNMLEQHQYPLPTPEDLFTVLNGGRLFTKLDFADAYLQVEVEDECKELLTINTYRGFYRYNRLPFGVKSAPGIFQQIMDTMIAGLNVTVAYLDDALAVGRTVEEYDHNLEALLNRVMEFGSKIRPEKCQFGLEEIKYLGFIVNKHGHQPDPEKIAAIQRMPPPYDMPKLRSFLGLLSYYGVFVKEVRELRALLDCLLKKGATFNWSSACQTTKVPKYRNTSIFGNADALSRLIARQFYNRRQSLTITDGCLLFADRVVVPNSLQRQVLRQLHTGHPGIVRMKALARGIVYWPGLVRQIKDIVQQCSSCASVAKLSVKATPSPWSRAERRWSRIHVNYAGPIDGRYFLILVDSFSKWPEIFTTERITTTSTISLLNTVIARFCTLEAIVSHNGRQFTAAEFKNFCPENGIQQVFTPPGQPQSNGQAETFVNTLKRSLLKMKGEGPVAKIVEKFLLSYRSSNGQTHILVTPNHQQRHSSVGLCVQRVIALRKCFSHFVVVGRNKDLCFLRVRARTSYRGHTEAHATDGLLDVKLIPEFDGSPGQSIVEWLKKVELVCKLRGIKDVANVIPLRLTGGVLAVYLRLPDEDKEKVEKLENALLAAFEVDQFIAYEQFITRRLNPGELPDVFLADLQRLASLFGGVSERELSCAFVTGLPDDVRHLLRAGSV